MNARAARQRERGQILPLWGASTITTLVLAFVIINYGNTVRYQVRAQNAADAAAQAIMAIQTQRFNELTAALYTSNVEEYRTRLLLDGILQTLDGSGGCTGAPTPASIGQAPFATGSGTCDQAYQQLVTPFYRAVNRYTTDVERVNDIATASNYANWVADSNSLLLHLSSANTCNTTTTPASGVHDDGGDCAFRYTLNGQALRGNLNAVSADAVNVFVPTQGFTLPNNAETEVGAYFDPGMVDVVVCEKVPPIIPNFAVMQAKTHYVIGRAGATAVLTEEDWLQPGALIDPARPGGQTYFQPYENYTTAGQNATANGGYDWYGVLFGGNAWQIGSFVNPQTGVTDYGYTSIPTINDLSAYVGWWSSIPYDPRNVDSTPISVASDCPP